MALCWFWQRWLIIKLGTVINLLVVCLWNSEETTAIKRDFSPAALLEKHRSKLNSEIVVFIAYADDKIFISAWQHFFLFPSSKFCWYLTRNFLPSFWFQFGLSPSGDIWQLFFVGFATVQIWILVSKILSWTWKRTTGNFFFPNASIIIFFVNDGADFDPNPHDVLPSKNSALLPPCS